MVVDPNYHPTYKLTPRQIEVLQLAASGMSYLQIAQQLKIGGQTVKNIIAEARKRLAAHNLAQAVYIATSLQIITPWSKSDGMEEQGSTQSIQQAVSEGSRG